MGNERNLARRIPISWLLAKVVRGYMKNKLRPLLIDSDVTVSTVGQKCSRVLGEK